MSDAQEPSVSQKGSMTRYAYSNCQDGTFAESEFFNISDDQIIDMTDLNIFNSEDREWAKRKTMDGCVRLIICSTDCKSDDYLEHHLHRECILY